MEEKKDKTLKVKEAKVLTHKDLDFGQIVYYVYRKGNTVTYSEGRVVRLTQEDAYLSLEGHGLGSGSTVDYKNIYISKEDAVKKVLELIN